MAAELGMSSFPEISSLLLNEKDQHINQTEVVYCTILRYQTVTQWHVIELLTKNSLGMAMGPQC